MWKIIKGWLPPKAINKIKFIDKKSIQTYIPEDQCLASWGGTDDYVFHFEPEEKAHNLMPFTNGDFDEKKVLAIKYFKSIKKFVIIDSTWAQCLFFYFAVLF